MSNENGAASPGRWHDAHFAWTSGATCSAKVTGARVAAASPLTGGSAGARAAVPTGAEVTSDRMVEARSMDSRIHATVGASMELDADVNTQS